MGGKSRKQPTKPSTFLRSEIDDLSCEHVDTKPRDVSGWFGDGDAHEEWSDATETEETCYESQRCEKCRAILTFAGGHSGGKHRDVWADSTDYDPDADDSDLTCDGYVSACEGPAMNYAYPCAWDDGADAARKLVDLPLVPVVMRDGTHALALTGGGMDLSWEICHAYIVLGFLPPLHHCSDLPRYAGKEYAARQALVLDAATRTAKVSAQWAERASERIADTRRWLITESRKIARARKARRS